MTFDLMARLVEASEERFEKAVVTAFGDEIFHATMWVHAGGRIHEFDAWPSDRSTLPCACRHPCSWTLNSLIGRA